MLIINDMTASLPLEETLLGDNYAQKPVLKNKKERRRLISNILYSYRPLTIPPIRGIYLEIVFYSYVMIIDVLNTTKGAHAKCYPIPVLFVDETP